VTDFVASRLCCHPTTPSDAVSDLRASILRSRDGVLEVAFHLAGALSRIRVPALGATRPGSRLWEHTCFELFVAPEPGRAYYELNLAPSGEWAIYAFRDYREAAGSSGELFPPDLSVHESEALLELEARISLPEPLPSSDPAPWRVGLSAVVEESDGRRSYWALRHPGDRPDFHHPDALALRLEPPPAG
jgi:hypothetical protein